MKTSALFIFCLLFLLSLSYIDRYFFQENGSFSLRHISSVPASQNSWEIDANPNDEALAGAILSQPFYYLTKGKQSFVFLSEDQQYVLKFYRFPSPIRPFPRLEHLWATPSQKREKAEACLKFLNHSFSSFKAAYQDLKDETAVIYTHLNPSSHLRQKIHIIDRLKIEHFLDADQTVFILQKKGDLLYSKIDEWIHYQEIDRAKEAIKSCLNLFASCYQKGYADEDCILYKNYGVIGTKAIILDIGQLTPYDHVKSLRDYVWTCTECLRIQLEKKSKELFHFYLEEFQKII